MLGCYIEPRSNYIKRVVSRFAILHTCQPTFIFCSHGEPPPCSWWSKVFVVSWLGVKFRDGAESLRRSRTAAARARWVSAILALIFTTEFWAVEGPRGLPAYLINIRDLTKERETHCFENQLELDQPEYYFRDSSCRWRLMQDIVHFHMFGSLPVHMEPYFIEYHHICDIGAIAVIWELRCKLLKGRAEKQKKDIQ